MKRADLCGSLAEAYNLHARLVFWRLRRSNVRESDVEDVVQEVFVTFNRYLHEVGMPDRVPLLLLAITENKVRNYRRDRRRFLARFAAEVEAEPESVPAPSSGSNPERIYARAEQERAVQRSIAELPAWQAKVLRTLELSETEAAAELGCREGTVKSARHRVKAYLQKLILRDDKKGSR